MAKHRALLIAPPWVEYKSPSLQTGSLAAFARRAGFHVDINNLYLETAIRFGLQLYDIVSEYCGDPLCAALLFPGQQKGLFKYVDRFVNDAQLLAQRIHHILYELYGRITWSHYNLVGFTAHYAQLFPSLLMARWIKRDHPNIQIVLGGTSVIANLGCSILKCFPQIDWCIDGEGELPFVHLLENLAHGRVGFEPSVPGLIYRHNNDIIVNQREQLASLRNLPNPDYDDYFDAAHKYYKRGRHNINPYLPIEVSRGCVHRCAYCGDHAYFTGHRHRPPAEISQSIKYLTSRYRNSSLFLVAQMIEQSYTDELFNLLALHKRDYKIFCEIRAGISKQRLSNMRRAGVYHVQIGIESFDTELLSKMNKGTRCIDNIETMKFCEELGIKHLGNVITEFPTESQRNVDTCTRNMNYALSYRPPIGVIPFTLLENSPVFRTPRKYGISKIDDPALWGRKLPRRIKAKLKLWYKEYYQKRKVRDYTGLYEMYNGWKQRYFEFTGLDGRPLLYYMDCGDFMRIEDHRKATRYTILEDCARDLYLFCASTKTWQQIASRFPQHDPKVLKKELDRLVRLELMFSEGDNYLSLAIRLRA